METLLGEFHFTHVKLTNARDLVLLVNNSRRFPLSLGKSDVNEILQNTITKESIRMYHDQYLKDRLG